MYIAIIEDEKILSKNIAKKLGKYGYSTNIYNTTKEFLTKSTYKADLYIIDISLPDGTGFEIIKWIREKKEYESPIIIISGYSDKENKIYGFDIGADDYLTKPFEPDELTARVRALIKRSYKIIDTSIIKYGDISYDIINKNIKIKGEDIDMNSKEKSIFEYFLFNKDKLVSKIDISKSIWGNIDLLDINDNTIHSTISKIRKKLGKSFKLKTIVNEGYILENNL